MQRSELNSDFDDGHVQRFLDLLFARGEIYRSSFDKICNAGYERESLGSLLYGLGWTSTHPDWSHRRLSDLKPFSRKEFDRLQSDLEDLAKRVERLNAHNAGSGKLLVALLESELRKIERIRELGYESDLPDSNYELLKDDLEQARKMESEEADRRAVLPRAMRDYAAELRMERNRGRGFKRRRTLPHFQLWNLLGFIERETGTPHYEEVSTLVTGGFLVFGGSETRIPRAFNAGALAKLKRRMSADNKVRS